MQGKLRTRVGTARRLLTGALLAPLMLASVVTLAPAAGANSLAVTFTLTPIAFGSATVGTVLSAQSVLTNTSSAALYFAKAVPNASNAAAEFQGSVGDCLGPITPGASCNITVVFKPHTAKLRSSTVFVTMVQKSPGGQVIHTGTVGTTVSGTGVAPTFTLSAVAAGPVTVGSMGTASSTVTNTSITSLVFAHSLVKAPKASAWAIQANACPASLSPGASCSIVLSFRPHHSGLFAAALVVVMDVAGTKIPVAVTAAVTGTGVSSGGHSGAISLTPLAFGTVTVGSSTNGDVVLTNTSTFTESLAHEGVLGNISGSFAIAGNNCPGSLAPATSCDIHVTFAPTNGKAMIAALTVTVSQKVGTKTVARFGQTTLSGTGQSPAYSVVVPSFPQTTVGNTSAELVTVTNTSLVPLTFEHALLIGSDQSDWQLITGACNGTLAVGSSCSLEVTFTPRQQGSLSITLNVAMHFGASPHQHIVVEQGSPSGVSVLPSFSVGAPTFASTASGSNSSADALVTNNSDTNLAYAGFSVHGANSSDFTVTGTDCPATIAPSATCHLTLRFMPTQSAGSSEVASVHVVMAITGTNPLVSVSQDTAISGQVSP